MVPSFEKRVRAFAIDTSGVALVGILAIGVSPQSETLSYVIFLSAAFFFYLFPYFRNTGQTLGKRVQKIKVVLKDGSQAPIWLLLLRDTSKVLASVFTAGALLVGIPITILYMFFQRYLIEGIMAGATKG